MNKDNSFDITKIKLDDIVVTNANIKNETNLIVLDKNKYYFQLTYSFEIAISIEIKKMRLIFSCGVETYEKETKTKVDVSANFQIGFYFIVENIEDIIGEKNGDTYEIDQQVGVTLSNLSYSTARGIMFTRCQGTPFKYFILPILPTSDIISMHEKATSGIKEIKKILS